MVHFHSHLYSEEIKTKINKLFTVPEMALADSLLLDVPLLDVPLADVPQPLDPEPNSAWRSASITPLDKELPSLVFPPLRGFPWEDKHQRGPIKKVKKERVLLWKRGICCHKEPDFMSSQP